MGYQLLWLEGLGFNLLAVALVTACSARLKRRGWQIAWPAAVAALFLLNGTFCVVFSVMARASHLVFPWLGYFLSLELLSLAGAAGILWRGLRRTGTGTDEPVPAARSWPRARLAVAALIALGLSFMTFQDLDAAVNSELAALRVEAGALAVSVAPPGVPEAENAALLYEQAFEALPDEAAFPPQWRDQIGAQWQQAPEAHVGDADFSDYLKRHASALAFFRLAAARPACHFDRNFAHPSVSMILPEVQKMRQGARLLAADARIRTSRGDAAGAAGDIVALRSMARHMRSDPILISLMVSMAMDGLADAAVEHWLARGEFRGSEPLDAVRQAGGPALRRDLIRAFRMEEATGLATFADLSSGTLSLAELGSEGASGLGLPRGLNRDTLGAWRVFFLRGELDSYRWHMGRVQSLAACPYHQSRARWADSEAEPQQPTGILTRLLLPAAGRVSQNAARAEARGRLADLAVAMARHRLKHGRYPEKLDDLGPEAAPLLLADPFDGRPLRMIPADGGVVLYSVGPDGRDDGGQEYDPQARAGDITFCLGAAYQARRLAPDQKKPQ